jgi:hypothetical protein
MAKKQPIIKENAAAASSTRSAKPKAPRVKAAQHSKAVSSEPVINQDEPVVTQVSENHHDAIAAIAYGYWEARGFKGGTPQEDWVRAEQEYRHRLHKSAA